ncbi:DUF3617 domain-containing protein [Aurantiacibacter gangjinensis]|uniref:Uncharacterized protein n=1 Tax=Aurantiacibacter gangjinensis TaxID=502682 RepID=A0A0G9MN38_9SPHN|nr:DUF3617 domain-containing protein [Aurantiacibacter gangjinensis]APE28160.1 hypothetical protein BMF35_a1331 [Aurantiacibacter gangjinensis]KLE32069.1 hypothetical protein AAW01_11680 [Aurantiacibacter gangjinensis]
MNTRLAFVAISTLALAACGDSGVVEDPSDPEQIAAATANLPTPQAGEYRITGDLVDLQVEGVSDQEAQMMRTMFEGMFAQERTQCLSQDDIDEGHQQLLEGLTNTGEGCEYTAYAVSGNTIDATMQCNDTNGTSGTMEFDGTVTETSQNITLAMDMTAEGQGFDMTLNMTQERVGDC